MRLVQTAGDEHLHPLEPPDVQLPADLADDLGEVPLAGGGCIQPHALQAWDRLAGGDGLRHLVQVRVHQGDAGHVLGHVPVERLEGGLGASQDDGEGVGHGALG